MENEKYTRLVNLKKVVYGNGKVEYRFYKNPIKIGVEKDIEKPKYIDFDGIQVDSDSGVIRSDESLEHSIKSSLSRTVNKIYELAFSNTWDWFLTFTFDEKKVDRYNYDECLSKLCKFFNNFKSKKCSNLKYLVVPEKHKDGAFHFHGLLSNVDKSFFELSNINDVYNFTPYKLGFSTATKVNDTHKVSTYITKYITKDLIVETSRRRYLCSKDLKRPDEEYDYIPADEMLKFKAEVMQTANYINEKKIDKINQLITYVHI